MLLIENVRLALFSLKANKMRALLTMLGIIIGIAAVIAIMTVGNSVTIYITDTMSSMGAANITVGLQQRTQEEERTLEGLAFGMSSQTVSLREEDFFTKQMLENYCNVYQDSIAAVSAQQQVGSGQIREEKRYANINVSGVSLGFFLANEMTLLGGRYFNETETEEARQVAIISDKAVNNMFDGDIEKALGSMIQVSIGDKFYTFTVIGVYEYENTAFAFSSTSEKDRTTNFYIPLRTGQELARSSGYSQFTVVTRPEVDPDRFAAQTESFFGTYYRNNRNFEPMAFSLSSMVDALSEMLSTLTTAISVIAGIALLVGGIGVMNIMLVSITERTREIGTRKALGAPNSSIRMQFIIEAIVICTIGGMIGITLGIIAGIAAANYMGTPANPSLGSVILSLSFSMVIGIFFGYHPANKAAKMDPIEALRYE